jgi:hypothetical protein
LDTAHGFYNPGRQYVGRFTERMERGKSENKNDLYCGYCYDYALRDTGWLWQLIKIKTGQSKI